MTHGRSTRISLGKLLTELDMKKLISSLTNDLACIEDKMIAAWRAGKSKISSTSSDNYLVNMKELVERLRSIALTLFNETEISKVKPYREKDKVPENYDKYLRVSENMARLVSQDILDQPDVDHAVAAFDRWLFICKIAFHQHDFFTSSCILNGLSALSVQASRIEGELCQTSKLLLKYYENILDKSSSLYHKQNELLKYQLEVIPALHALTNLYDKLGSHSSKKEKSNPRHVAEIADKRRSVSKHFILMQKKEAPTLDDEDRIILTTLYQKFDEKLSTTSVMKRHQDRSSTKPFSVASFAKLVDARVKLIVICSSIQKMESKYDAPISDILYEVKSILKNVVLTDRMMYAKINEEFDFTDVKWDKKTLNLHKKIKRLLQFIIKQECKYGIFFKGTDLKMTTSLEETKNHSRKKKSVHKLKEIGDSRAAFEEKSTPTVQPKAKALKISLSDAESELSKVEKPKLQSPMLVTESSMVESQKTELLLPAIQAKIPDISSSIHILSELVQQNSTRQEGSVLSSVRSELEELKTTRSVSLGKMAYEELIKKNSGLISSQQNVMTSPRLRHECSGSATFFIKKAQISSGSLTTRAEGSLKETASDNSGRMGVERPKQ